MEAGLLWKQRWGLLRGTTNVQDDLLCCVLPGIMWCLQCNSEKTQSLMELELNGW